MNFKDQLSQYIEQIGCTIGQLASASGISASALSRYRSGERTPAADSQQLSMLADGICTLAAERGFTQLTPDAVLSAFQTALIPDFDAAAFCAKVDYIITELNIHVSALAKALNYDASFISRIRAGSRTPADKALFVQKLSYYIVKNYTAGEIIKSLDERAADETDISADAESLTNIIMNFFLSPAAAAPTQATSFLHKLDDFDLNDYIRSVHFDELKVPSAPFQFPTSKEYFGVEGQQKGELDFLKGTVLSKSKEPVFMCSDMDMTDMAKDMDFSKKWMLGLAMLLKKNTPIRIVHNLNRPFSELMLGLEAWIPLYMTGLVTPYYLKGTHNQFYQHLLYTSGSFAFSGECIKGFHNRGRYLLTNSKEDVNYFQTRAECILKKALPLIDIYTSDQPERFLDFYRTIPETEGTRHHISSSLPVFTLPEEMLTQILQKNNISEADSTRLRKDIRAQRAMIEQMLSKDRMLHEVPLIHEREFAAHPLILDLSQFNYTLPIRYDYEDYANHLHACEVYAAEHENYRLYPRRDFAFRNIQIRILEGKWVWITKIKSPMIHFVIRHPLLRDAIEKMDIPVQDA